MSNLDVHYWLDPQGEPITCQEQIKILAENWEEIEEILKNAFDDACLMGVSEAFFKKRLADYVRELNNSDDDLS